MKIISSNQISKKHLNKDFTVCYKALFESKLAVMLSQESKQFQSVKKISDYIITLLLKHKEVVLSLIKQKKQIIAELREPYFGSCFSHEQLITPMQTFVTMLATLSNQKSELSQIMQIHSVFIHRLYDKLESKPEKTDLIKQLFPDMLFKQEARGRIEKNPDEIKLTCQLGITQDPKLSKQIGYSQSGRQHIRAIDKYIPDLNSSFFKSLINKKIPVVSGASGHAGSLFLGALLYGQLTYEELGEYAWACFAFLTAGGHHSFYEVMIIANLAGLNFDLENYWHNLPKNFKKNKNFEALQQDFSDLLSSNQNELQKN